MCLLQRNDAICELIIVNFIILFQLFFFNFIKMLQKKNHQLFCKLAWLEKDIKKHNVKKKL